TRPPRRRTVRYWERQGTSGRRSWGHHAGSSCRRASPRSPDRGTSATTRGSTRRCRRSRAAARLPGTGRGPPGALPTPAPSRVGPASDSGILTTRRLSMWDFGSARKQTVTAEYLGQRLADEIWKDVHKPQDPIPSTYIVWEWLILRTFVATRVVQTLPLLNKDAADRALYAMRARVCHPARS